MDFNNYEVLAPIGNYEEIDLVLNEKPDAVYIGLKGKTSRPSVSDFSMEQLKKAIIKCHEKNIKIYVAINSNISQDAMDELLKNIYELDRDGVDAFILADFGLIKTVSHKLKNAKIHASTLLGAYNINTVRLLKELGVTRIIFYANLYIDEIAKIINAEPDLEYELVAEGGTCFNDIRQCRLPHITDDNKHILYCRNGCMLCDENNIKKGKMIADHPL